MSSEIRLKLSFDDKTFRRTADPATFSWADFRAWAVERYPDARQIRNLKISYQDEDGDEICIMTEEDFREAMSSHVKAGLPLRIQMIRQRSEDSSPASSLSSSSATAAPTSSPPSTTTATAAPAPVATAMEVDIDALLEEEASAAAAAAGVTDLPPPKPSAPAQSVPQARQQPPQQQQQAQQGQPQAVPLDDVLRQVLGHLRGRASAQNVSRAIGATRDHVLPLVELFTPPAVSHGVTGIVADAFNTAERIVGGPYPYGPHAPPPPPYRGDGAADHAPPPPPPPHHGRPHNHPCHRGRWHRHPRNVHPVHPEQGPPPMCAHPGQGGPMCQQGPMGRGPPPPHSPPGHGPRAHGPRHCPHAPPMPTPEGPMGPMASEDGQVRHWGVRCDRCKTQDFAGVRYKDSVRRDFDLCAACEAVENSTFPMLKIRDPSQAPLAIVTVLPPEEEVDYSNDENRVHVGVVCDGCGADPIVGDRFRCTRRPNFDLCADCEAKDTTGHPLLKLRLPSQAPRHIHVTGANGRVCRWMNRGANAHAWRAHRDRLRDLARARAQPSSEQVPVAAEIVTGVPVNNAAPYTHASPMPMSSSHSEVTEGDEGRWSDEAMLEEALRMSMEHISLSPSGGLRQREEGGGGGGPAECAKVSKLSESHDAPSSRTGVTDQAGLMAMGGVTAVPPTSTVQVVGRGKDAPRPYNARFVADATFPDGTVVQPRVELHKTWVLANSGSSPFPEDTRLVFVAGHLMDGPAEGVHVGPIAAGEEFHVTVPLVAPAENRAYRSCWILQSEAAGSREQGPLTIGSRVWIDVMVDDDGWCWVPTTHPQMAQERQQQAQAQDEEEAAQQEEEGRQMKEEEEEATAGVTSQMAQLLRSAYDVADAELAAPTPDMPDKAITTADAPAQAEAQAEAEAAEVEEVQGGGAAPTAPSALTAAVVERERDYTQWGEQLQTLTEAGFMDLDRCVDVLEALYLARGMDAVVDTLLQEQ